tara:strand:- start:1186 stop:1785 length:600 start_codon:yes stop_codon:yes gene_type:complete
VIDKIKGIIEEKTTHDVIISSGNFSFIIKMSINSLDILPGIGQEVEIFTYLHVREDLLQLFGFAKKLERETFELLISISGIGPKLALVILSGSDTDNLKSSIVSGDIRELTRIPGVGNKTAKRIIIELKEKFIDSDDSSLGFKENNKNTELSRDVINALVSLGYKPSHAQKVCNELEKDNLMRGKLELIIKNALGRLMS